MENEIKPIFFAKSELFLSTDMSVVNPEFQSDV